MSEALETTVTAEISTKHQYAEKLHNQILYNAQMVADYLFELCKGLKRMRDEKLYLELGFDTFEDYVEKDVHIRQRMAYNYISTYERLGATTLQSNASLGITKLAILAEIPATERADFTEGNDLENMSSREMKDLADKLKDTGEQLSLVTQERDDIKAQIEDADSIAEEAEEKAKKAEEDKVSAEKKLASVNAELQKLKQNAPDPTAIEKARKEAEKNAKADFEEKLRKEKEKAAREVEAKIKAAHEEGVQEGREAISQEVGPLIREKAEAQQRAQELEKKLAVAGNQNAVIFAHIFQEFQENLNRLNGIIMKMKSNDVASATKFKGALSRFLSIKLDEMEAAVIAPDCEPNERYQPPEDTSEDPEDDTDQDVDDEDGDDPEE